MIRSLVVLLLIALLQAPPQVQAFAPPRPATYSSATRIAAARPAHAAALVLRMAEGSDDEEEKTKAVSADGTFYDDEVSVFYYIVLYSLWCIPSLHPLIVP
jgi:hypothetical protein